MKVTLLLTLVCTLSLSAGTTYSQQTKLSMNVENATLKELLNEIGKNSEFSFWYSNNELNDKQRVTVSIKDQTIDKILDLALEDQGLTYRIRDKVIFIYSSSYGKNETLGIQQQKIIGMVTDATNGEPIIGANIMVEGTTVGVITDVNGKFSLDIPSKDAVIVISYIGYNTEKVALNGQSAIEVKMVPDITKLDEIVVVGYGTQKKSDLTGSVASVKSETIKNLPVKSLAEALQGKVSGVYITKGTGEPGAGSDIIIRGAASINGLGPLYIVDGVRMGTGNSFNMTDVENIEILKDASSAAIYGVEAAGGVILVTTKKGRNGDKMNIDFNAYYGTRSAVNLPELLGSKDYIAARKVLGTQYASWDNSTDNTNWIAEMYSPATEQKYDLSLSGGTEKSSYFISTGYLKEEGIRKSNWFERYSLRMNTEHKLAKKFTVGQFLYIHKTRNRPTGDGSSIPYRSIPMMAVYDASRVGGWAAVPEGFQGANWVGTADSRIYNNNGWGMEGNFYADWKIVKGLNLRATGGGYMGGSDDSQFDLLYDYGIIKNGIRKLTKSLSRNETINGNIVLTYEKVFGKHEVKAMAGWEVIKSNGTNINARTEGFPVYYMPSFNTSTQASNARFAEAGYGRGTQLAQFGRLNYNFAGKYLVQATVRRDGTNKFIGDNQYGIFPSVSGAWKISEESFLKDNVNWLNMLKLRGGWGVLGSIGSVGDFIYQTAYRSVNTHSFDGTNTVTGWGNSKFANADIRWEKVTTKNVGLDLGLLQNRLTLGVDFYDKQTNDMIYNVSLPASSGLGLHNSEFTATINIGKISNKGVEFELNWNDKLGEFVYSIGGNASFNKNKVVQIGTKGAFIYEGGTAWMNGSISRTEDGYAMGQFYGFVAKGIYQTDAEAAAGPQQTGKVAKSGDLIYLDLNSKDASGNLTGTPDGKIDDSDKTYLGSPWPKCFYGFNLNMQYKGFDLKIFFQGQAGVKLFNSTKGIRQSFYSDWNTTSEIFNTSKFGNTTITDLPSVYQINNAGEVLRDPNGNYKNVSSYFVENGAYLKLKDLQIGYTLPEKLTKKVGLNSTRIFIAGSNLFTITKYTGLDPELGGNVRRRGVETDGLYPQTRFISVGANLKF